MNELRKFDWRKFKDEELKRSFMRAITLLGDSGISNLEKLEKWKRIKTDMNRLFSTAKIILNNQTLPLDPNISALFQQSNDYNLLTHLWTLWRDASGKKISKLYPDYVVLSNEAVKEYGYSDFGEYVRSSFEVDDLTDQFDEIYSEIEEIYRLLHAYVKKKLANVYSDHIREDVGALPAHLMGDMWAQQWHNIYDVSKILKFCYTID